MRHVRILELRDAELMLEAAAEEASRRGWNVSMAVVDQCGCLMAFKKMDRATVSSAQTAIQKARSAALTKRPTKFFEDMVNAGRPGAAMIDGVFPIEGGLPVQVGDETVGGLAVSGLKSELDLVLVEAGLSAFARHCSTLA
ncbi:heme-binding protein [Pseudomonas sp. P1B16]|uniref:GlcG/HbpS family heme-binding protein n=1 Tax=Pseudomonas sp. P1B16 TaxID=2986074 RepID=UPI002A23DD0F|nr:heme-binding protein [Pseudomonas sp. P1B16]WPM28270.1 heme-binding protein [Pseudomonas sp. P1B16]